MNRFSSFLIIAGLWLNQQPVAVAQPAPSPYSTRFWVDAPITTALGATSLAGLYLVQQKHGLTEEQLAALDQNDLPKLDRFSAGFYSEKWQTAGDLLCYPSLVIAPGLLALNDNVRGRYGQVLALYLETLAVSDAAFTMTVGNVYRYRPYLYGSEGGSSRTGKIATNSFFAGHTAHTATATFFAAKVYHDFNLGSGAEPWIWTAAALYPMAVAYARIEAGKHFLTDNLVGYAVGATLGVVVPQLHKSHGDSGLTVLPAVGVGPTGAATAQVLVNWRLTPRRAAVTWRHNS